MSEKIPIISRGQPITAEYLNSLSRAVNAGQIVLPGAVAGGASISSPTGSGSSPSSDVRTWTITSVTEVGGIATSLTMTDGAGSIWTINNVDDLCNLCGGGGGGGVTNYIMAVTIEQINGWGWVRGSLVTCTGPGTGSYYPHTLGLSNTRRVYWCQNGDHDATVWANCYVKLLNGGVAVPDWNFTSTSVSKTLYTWPNIPGSNPNPAGCSVPAYVTMSQFLRSQSGSAGTCPGPTFVTALPSFDQLQLLSTDNATVIFDLDLSGSACEDYSLINSTGLSPDGFAWVECMTAYQINTSPCTCAGTPILTILTGSQNTLRKSWILAAPP